jgi:hypothetical protein
MVLHNFIERITEKGIVEKIREQGRRFYRFKTTPACRWNFSVVAYHLGHSMVRDVYSFNRIFTPTPPPSNGVSRRQRSTCCATSPACPVAHR